MDLGRNLVDPAEADGLAFDGVGIEQRHLPTSPGPGPPPMERHPDDHDRDDRHGHSDHDEREIRPVCRVASSSLPVPGRAAGEEAEGRGER